VPRRTTGQAYARAGLLGNPSDQYRGKAIAVPVCNFAARVILEEADAFSVAVSRDEGLDGASFREVALRLRERGCYETDRLIRAALRGFALHWPEWEALPDDDPRLRFRLRCETTIPRQAGLAGSSALVIAALRALAGWFQVPVEPLVLAKLALSAETRDLGIQAGPMDRIVQAHATPLVMDFREPWEAASHRPLDPAALPPLFLVWDPHPGRPSGIVHADVRLRWLAGDPDVRAAMKVFPRLVDEGVACLGRGDWPGFKKLVDRNFDTRAAVFDLSERDLRLVRIGRERGAAVKLCGSGGAVVGVLDSERDFPAVASAYEAAGFRALRPALRPESG
jgi:glucuronokinase